MDALTYREARDGRRFLIRIQPGSRLLEQIVCFAESVGLKHGVMISAIGSIRNVTFRDIQSGAHLPITQPRMPQHTVEGPLGLIGLEGNLVPGPGGRPDAHLHVVCAKSSGEVVGGHLMEAEVFATCEVVLAEYLVDGVERQRSATGGVDTLYFEGEQP